MMIAFLLAAAAPTPIQSDPSLGTEDARCRPAEAGPAILVDAVGLKDRAGRIRVEVYPSNDKDFLADDNILVEDGKVFRRVDERVPQSGPVELCIRVPRAGAYSLLILHDRDSNRKFSLSSDGIGFPGNPKLGWSKPKAAQARILVGPGLTRTKVVMNYRQSLLSFGPIRRREP